MADRAPRPYQLTIRTPSAALFDGAVLGVRVPTQTGMVGLRPGGEALVLVVVPGLIVMRTAEGERFAATAGGLLDSDHAGVTLLTPYAAVGSSEDEILAALAEMFAHPDSQLVARRKLEELEQRILLEVGRRPPSTIHGGPNA